MVDSKSYEEIEQELALAKARIAELETLREQVRPEGGAAGETGPSAAPKAQPSAPALTPPAPQASPPPVDRAGDQGVAGLQPKAIRVLLADDHAVVRDGLTRLLQGEPGIQVVGQAADGLEVVQMALKFKPDIILMDVSMPYLSGVDVTRRLTQQLPGIRVIGLSMHPQEDIGSAMTGAGAVAYLTKNMNPEALVAAIREYARQPVHRSGA